MKIISLTAILIGAVFVVWSLIELFRNGTLPLFPALAGGAGIGCGVIGLGLVTMSRIDELALLVSDIRSEMQAQRRGTADIAERLREEGLLTSGPSATDKEIEETLE